MADNTVLKDMGERIYNRRKSIGLTQEELAEAVGVSTQMISNLECGKKAIRPENLVKVCSVLDLNADYVLTGKHENSILNDIVTSLSALSKDELLLIRNMVDIMKKNK